MKHPNKHHARDKRCEENMAVLNKWKQTQPAAVFDWKSSIHLRITLDGQWTDFWPTTGKWYDPTRSAKGSSVETLINILRMKTGTKKPPHPGLVGKPASKPSILERLAIIDQHINAIRTELREKEPKKTVEPPPPEAPYYFTSKLGVPDSTKYYSNITEMLADNDDSPPWSE